MDDATWQVARNFLESWLEYRARQTNIPGFCVAISSNYNIIFSQAFGVANLELNTPLTTTHLFGVASQTKMFTATAIMQLVKTGKLQLEDRACNYVPWLTEHRDKRMSTITIRQLLSHSAGLLRDGLNSDFWELKRDFPSVTALRDMVLAAKLTIEPNTQLKYSNVGFALLGQIIETVSGSSYTQFITEHIIRPLHLQHTFPDYKPALADRVATAYGPAFDHKRHAFMPRLPTRAIDAAIGVHATPEDLCRFASAHCFSSEVLLNKAAKKEMQRNQWMAPLGYFQGTGFGLGFEELRIGKRRLVGHSGHLAGYCSATFFDPQTSLVVSVAANCKDTPSVRMVRGIFGVLDWFQGHAVDQLPDRLAKFGGQLRNHTATVTIIPEKTQLTAIDPDDWEPFRNPDELEYVDTSTLRVTTPGNIYNQGELVSYTFSDNVIQAVKFAGLTMLPEPQYHTVTHAVPSNAPALNGLFSLADLRRSELTIGQVIEVAHSGPSEPGTYQLTADFGPSIGIVRSFLHHLPGSMAMHQLRGCTIIGASYPVWRFDESVRDLLVLGITSGSADFALPDQLLTLAFDPSRPQTLPPSVAVKLYEQHYAVARTYFKFEPVPEYAPEDTANISYTAWLQGKYRKSIALMKPKYMPPWFEAHRQGAKQRIRIRIVDSWNVPQQRWEIEIFKRIHIPLIHESVYLLPRKYLAGVRAPASDMVVMDNKRVMVNGYRNNFVTHSTFYDPDKGHYIHDFTRLQQQLINLAQTFGTKLST